MHGQDMLSLSRLVSSLCLLPAEACCSQSRDGGWQEDTVEVTVRPAAQAADLSPPPLLWPLEQETSWNLSLLGTCQWMPLAAGTSHLTGTAPAPSRGSETTAS